MTAQSIKICVDTLVQAHVDDEFKGRVFVIYDVIFNVALVLAAVIGAVILPTNGRSVLILVLMAVGYLLVAALFAFASRSLDMDRRHRVADRRRPLPGLGCPPAQEFRAGAVLAEGAFLHPALQQPVVGPADGAARRDAEDLHDLAAVEIGRMASSSSCAASSAIRRSRSSYAARKPPRLRGVPGRAVGAGQDVQPLELVAGVADIAAYGGVGPGGVALHPRL